eukprot:SM000040S14861  [mRNA]  locus=s40:806466:808887:- [translate_table: standard]
METLLKQRFFAGDRERGLDYSSGQAFVCKSCGVQYSPSANPPDTCRICSDDRQFIGRAGQEWATAEGLHTQDHRNSFQLVEPNCLAITTEPKFGIGQRAFLIRSPGGNVLWDCLSFLDEATVEIIKALGGIRAIAISHPHFLGNCVEWSRAFGDCPVYIHSLDRKWVTWQHDNIHFWNNDMKDLGDGVVLLNIGGHFAGSSVLAWAEGANGKGSLLTGDTFQVAADRESISVMRSYPNYIPVSIAAIKRIQQKLVGWQYENLHGAFTGLSIMGRAKTKTGASLDRYLHWLHVEDPMA